jgi:GNAT superfamily N-acetyltransferase
MKIRRATEADLETLTDLWMRMMEEHAAFEPRLRLAPAARPAYHCYLQLHCRAPRSLVVLAEEPDGEIRGFCCAYVCQNLTMFLPAELGYVSDLYLAPEARGQGRGREIVGTVVDWFRGQGVSSVQLQVYRANAAGHEFWKTMGFEPYFDRMNLEL